MYIKYWAFTSSLIVTTDKTQILLSVDKKTRSTRATYSLLFYHFLDICFHYYFSYAAIIIIIGSAVGPIIFYYHYYFLYFSYSISFFCYCPFFLSLTTSPSMCPPPGRRRRFRSLSSTDLWRECEGVRKLWNSDFKGKVQFFDWPSIPKIDLGSSELSPLRGDERRTTGVTQKWNCNGCQFGSFHRSIRHCAQCLNTSHKIGWV